MAQTIGSFTFGVMRGRLNPDASPISASGRVLQKGLPVPMSGVVTTEVAIATKALAVAKSAAYRAIIGSIVACDINGDSITQVLVSDCKTSIVGALPSISIVAEWKLVAYVDWEP